MILAASFVGAVGLLTSGGVYAALTAVATGTESVSSGTLLLTLSADAPSAGFPSTFTNMAPGDIDNVYVNLNNTGSIAGLAGITLGVAGVPANALTNGTVTGEGLSVALTQCSVAWAAGVCGGTTTALLATTAISTLATPAALATPALVATTGAVSHIKVSLTLAAVETSTNGSPPASTVQGLPATTLTYTFTELQRAGITTNQ